MLTQKKVSILQYIGLAHFKMGQYENALGCYNEAVNVAKTTVTHNKSDWDSLYHNIGICHERLNQLVEAIRYKKRALALRESALKARPESQSRLGAVLRSLNSLAITYGTQGDLKRVIYYDKQALRLKRQALNLNLNNNQDNLKRRREQGRDIAETMYFLGVNLCKLNKWRTALDYFELLEANCNAYQVTDEEQAAHAFLNRRKLADYVKLCRDQLAEQRDEEQAEEDSTSFVTNFTSSVNNTVRSSRFGTTTNRNQQQQQQQKRQPPPAFSVLANTTTTTPTTTKTTDDSNNNKNEDEDADDKRPEELIALQELDDELERQSRVGTGGGRERKGEQEETSVEKAISMSSWTNAEVVEYLESQQVSAELIDKLCFQSTQRMNGMVFLDYLRLVSNNRMFFEQLISFDDNNTNNTNNNDSSSEQFDKLVNAIEKLIDEDLTIEFAF